MPKPYQYRWLAPGTQPDPETEFPNRNALARAFWALHTSTKNEMCHYTESGGKASKIRDRIKLACIIWTLKRITYKIYGLFITETYAVYVRRSEWKIVKLIYSLIVSYKCVSHTILFVDDVRYCEKIKEKYTVKLKIFISDLELM